jgi:hypothetical protein
MVNNKEETKNCTEKTTIDNKNKGGGYMEPKDPLTNKAKRHSAVALKNQFKKEQISKKVAITPAEKEHKEDITSPETAVKAVEIADKDKDIITLRFEDTGEFLTVLKKFQKENNHLELAMDYDESYLIGVPLPMVESIRKFMTGKGIKEVTENTIEDRIRDVQTNRSRLAIAIDKRIKAKRVGEKQNPLDLLNWAGSPNTLDLLNAPREV